MYSDPFQPRTDYDKAYHKEYCNECCTPQRTPGGYTVCHPHKYEEKRENYWNSHPKSHTRPSAPIGAYL